MSYSYTQFLQHRQKQRQPHQMADPQLQSHTTTNGTPSTRARPINPRSALKGIIGPFALVVTISVLGLGIYLFLRSRRRLRKARGRQSQTDTERGSVFGDEPRTEMGIRNSMPVVEGLNELGEAPPPYEGVKEAREPVGGALECGESSTSVRGRDGRLGDGGGEQPTEERPPPAYVAAEVRETPRLFLTPSTPGRDTRVEEQGR